MVIMSIYGNKSSIRECLLEIIDVATLGDEVDAAVAAFILGVEVDRIQTAFCPRNHIPQLFDVAASRRAEETVIGGSHEVFPTGLTAARAFATGMGTRRVKDSLDFRRKGFNKLTGGT